MKVTVLSEYGIAEAAYGLGLSYDKTSDLDPEDYIEDVMYGVQPEFPNQVKVMEKLAGKGCGHDKFLRMITINLFIDAPLYWWSEFDTYKIGTTAQSASKNSYPVHKGRQKRLR